MTGRGEEVLFLTKDNSDKDLYPQPEKCRKTTDYTLADIFDGDEYKGKVDVSYEYDHGDSWDHEILFLGRADPSLRKALKIPDEVKAFCFAGEVCIIFTQGREPIMENGH
jgi:hypothetical protein